MQLNIKENIQKLTQTINKGEKKAARNTVVFEEEVKDNFTFEDWEIPEKSLESKQGLHYYKGKD